MSTTPTSGTDYFANGDNNVADIDDSSKEVTTTEDSGSLDLPPPVDNNPVDLPPPVENNPVDLPPPVESNFVDAPVPPTEGFFWPGEKEELLQSVTGVELEEEYSVANVDTTPENFDILQDQGTSYTILSGAEITAALLPEARRGGLEAGPVVELLHRAATTIDTLYDTLAKHNDETVEIAQKVADVESELAIKENEHIEELAIREAEHTKELSVKEKEYAEELAIKEKKHTQELAALQATVSTLQQQVEELEKPSPEKERERQATESSRILAVADRTAAALVQEAEAEAASIIQDAEARRGEIETQLERDLTAAQHAANLRIAESERLAEVGEAMVVVRRQEIEDELAVKRSEADSAKVALIRNLRSIQDKAAAERDRLLAEVLEIAEILESFSPVPVDSDPITEMTTTISMPPPSGNPVATGPVAESPW